MAVCGCAEGCGCSVRGTDGVTVAGSGTVDDPITIGIDPASGNGCDQIMACVTSRLGPGIRAENGTIAIQISTEGGNSATIGSDGGIFTPGCASCNSIVTVDTLTGSCCGVPDTTPPITTCVHAGDIGAGSLTAPTYTRASYDLGFAHWPQIGIWDMEIRQATDGTLWWRIDNPQAFTQEVIVHAGDPWYGQQWNLQTYNPATPPGNYHNYQSPQERPLSCYHILSTMGGNVVINLRPADGFTTTLRDLLWRMVSQLGLAKSVILEVSAADITKAATWTGNGGIAAIRIATGAEADSLTPATLTANGITWAYLHSSLTNLQITKFTSEPTLTCLSQLPATEGQPRAEAMRTLGCKGVKSGDPIYNSGPYCGYNYRATLDPYCMRQPWPGQNRRNGNVNIADTGTFTNDNGFCWWKLSATQPQLAQAVLQGWGTPINGLQTSPGTYAIEGVTKIVPCASMPSNTANHTGIMLGAPGDRYATDQGLGINAYVMRWNGNGQIQLATSKNNVYTVLATGATTVSTCSELFWKVQITATQIIVTYGPTAARAFSIPAQALDPVLNGGYFYFYQNRAAATTWEPYYRNIIIT